MKQIMPVVLAVALVGCASDPSMQMTTTHEYDSDGNALRVSKTQSEDAYTDSQLAKASAQCSAARNDTDDPLLAAMRALENAAVSASTGKAVCAGAANSNDRKIAKAKEVTKRIGIIERAVSRWIPWFGGGAGSNDSDNETYNAGGNITVTKGNNSGVTHEPPFSGIPVNEADIEDIIPEPVIVE